MITSYGVGRRVERAVNSILEQTLDNLEVVVVDDGSEDAETLESLDRLADTIPIERMTGRRGVGAARNRGLELTTNPYVLCLDGDDWVEPQYLEMAQGIFDTRPRAGIATAWVRLEGDRQGEWRPEDFALGDLMAANQICSASTFRRVASETVDFYAEVLGGYEDWEHWIAIVAEGWEARVIPEVLIHYEGRPGSQGRTADTRAQRLVEDIVSKHQGLFRENVGAVLGRKHCQVIALEAEAREAWKRGEAAETELQRVWGLVGELGEKLKLQGGAVDELDRELEGTRRMVRELREALADAQAGERAADHTPVE